MMTNQNAASNKQHHVVQHSNTMPRSFGSCGPPSASSNLSREPSAQTLNIPGGDTSSESGSMVGPSGGGFPQQTTNRNKRGFRSFGKGFFKMRSGGKWSSSAPNLGDQLPLCSRLACFVIAFI